MSATALSAKASVTRQAVTKHLRVLEGAGLVTHKRRGREVLHVLETKRFSEASTFLDTISTGWDRSLDRLRELVESPDPSAEAKA